MYDHRKEIIITAKKLKIILILKKLSVKIGNSLIGEIGDSLISGIIYIKN